MKKERLFDQFPPVSTKEWMDKIHSDLKGADFNKKMVWKTNDGLDINPFYREEDLINIPYIDSLPGEWPYIRGTKIENNRWYVRQNIEVNDYTEANRKALDILMKGIDSLGFVITDPESVNETNFRTLLDGIHIESIEINFLCNGKAKEIFSIIETISTERDLDPEMIRGAVEADPVGRIMVNGKLCIPAKEGFDYLASFTAAASGFPNFRTIHLDASVFNNAGADIVSELAFAISIGKEYMYQLTERGLSAEIAASCIRFSFGTGSLYFPEIGKLRAARLLWAVILKGFDIENTGANIHCVTSKWNKTIYDPYVNLLRTQTEAMSAIIGGADSLTVEPFDKIFQQPDEFSERIARNQQLILKEEVYLDKVADPSAGSYYIENLTKQIAENAWKLFLEIEEQGGFLSSAKTGYIQKIIKDSADKRRNDISLRKMVLLGTNRYPNTEESVSSSVESERVFYKKTYEDDLIVEPITLCRGSEEYDKIRMSVDMAARRPVVFLLPVGNETSRRARSQFSADFFGCGGYYIIDNYGFDTPEAGIKSAIESHADIVVICSSDDEYMLIAPVVYESLKDKAIIFIAGNPSSAEELKSKGIDLFIHNRSNVIETLNKLNIRLGIQV